MGKNDLLEQKKTYQKRKEDFELQRQGKSAKIKCRKCEERIGKAGNRINCGWNTGFLLLLVDFFLKKKKLKEQCNHVIEVYGKQKVRGSNWTTSRADSWG